MTVPSERNNEPAPSAQPADSPGLLAGLFAIALVLTLLLYAEGLYLGDLNQDEGWYLLAARQVHRGQLPYRDFFFTQAPLLPYLYGLLFPVWGPYGVAGGRLLTALLGLGASLLAAGTAARIVPRVFRRHAFTTAFTLLGVNAYHAYFTTVVKTYSLTAVFFCAAFYALSHLRTARFPWPAACAGIFLACAAGTRLSAGAAMPVVGLYLLWQRRQCGNVWNWVIFGVAGLLALAALFGPWLLTCGEGFVFGCTFHTQRAAGSALSAMINRAGFLSRCTRAYYVPGLVAGLGGLWAWLQRGDCRGSLPERNPADLQSSQLAAPRPEAPASQPPESVLPPRFLSMLFAGFLAVTLLHFSSPFPYDDYQTPVMPLLTLAGVALLWRCFAVAGFRSARLPGVVCVAVLVATVAAAASSELHQDWFMLRRDRFWWIKKEKPPLAILQETAQHLNTLYPSKGILLTQEAYLAVEAGWDVPGEFTMGPFSYFPDLDSATATRVHVVNRQLLAQLLATTPAPVAAFGGYSLAIAAPRMTLVPDAEQESYWKIIQSRYDPSFQVPYFGQAHTPLSVWVRKQPAR